MCPPISDLQLLVVIVKQLCPPATTTIIIKSPVQFLNLNLASLCLCSQEADVAPPKEEIGEVHDSRDNLSNIGTGTDIRYIVRSGEEEDSQERSASIQRSNWIVIDTFREIEPQYWGVYDDPIARFKRPRLHPNA